MFPLHSQFSSFKVVLRSCHRRSYAISLRHLCDAFTKPKVSYHQITCPLPWVFFACTLYIIVLSELSFFVLSVPIPPTLPRIFILFISITGPLFCFLCHVQGAFGRPLAIMRVSFRGWCIVLVLPLALICVIHPRLGRSDPPYCLCVIWTHSGLIYVICH